MNQSNQWKSWEEEFDKLWPCEQFTERSLTLEEMEKRNTYYTKELVGMKAFIREVEAKAFKAGVEEGVKDFKSNMRLYGLGENMDNIELQMSQNKVDREKHL